MSDSIKFEIPTLSRKEFSYEKMKKFIKDKRFLGEELQKFLKLNQKAFRFMDIKAEIIPDDSKFSLCLTTSKYSGVIPLRSAKSGMVEGYLYVKGRYGEEVADILPLLSDENFLPEFDETMPILLDDIIRPPRYIECAKYLDLYMKAERYHWQKFLNMQIVQEKPRNTNWTKYALDSVNPHNVLSYPNRLNLLTVEHREWKELQYVLDLAIKELQTIKTPLSLRSYYYNTIERLLHSYQKNDVKKVENIRIRSSDPEIIKELKSLANLILSNISNSRCAWKIDHSQFFERYIQYIFGLLASKSGAKVIKNPHFQISGVKPAWVLKHLEPDLIYVRGGEQIVIDAKYKAHMYNSDSHSEELRSSFREDYHQVLAYSSFQSLQEKKTIIAYPNSKLKCIPIVTNSNLNECKNNTLLLGIPISKSKIPETIQFLREKLQGVESII